MAYNNIVPSQIITMIGGSLLQFIATKEGKQVYGEWLQWLILLPIEMIQIYL